MSSVTRRRWLSGVICFSVLAFAITGSAAASSPNSANARLKHVFVIVLENHARDQVIGDPNAPFITSLANSYGVAASYYGVTHPSEPNYVAMIAGDTFNVFDDNPANRFGGANLADQLEAHGMTWATYQESLPSTGYLGDFAPDSGHKLYASKHNPFVLFNDIRNNPARLQNIKSYTALAGDLAGNKVPDFSLIVPNQCHDMHGGVYSKVASGDGSPCPYGNVNNDPADVYLKQQADVFVKDAVTKIMSSKAWSGNSAIFIVADESDYNNNPANDGWTDTSYCCDSPFLPAGPFPDGGIGAPWAGGIYGGGLSPAIVITTHGPRGYVSSTPYNHYSLLTTIEKNWHLGYLGHAGDTAGGVLPMNDLLTH